MKALKTITVCTIYLFTVMSCSTFKSNVTNEPAPSVQESQKLVQDLLENNAGCRLPCWWGIQPGKTTWNEARQILEKVSSYVTPKIEGTTFYNASAKVYPPYPNDPERYMETNYRVENGVVRYISVYNENLTPNYHLSKFLEHHGAPTEIWIRTFPREDMGFQHFLIDMFYQDLGVLVEYGTGHPLEEVNGNIRNCSINKMGSPFLHLWSPETDKLSFQEAKIFIDTMSLPEPKTLLEATGMDAKTFFETFKNPETNVCIETPRELWE